VCNGDWKFCKSATAVYLSVIKRTFNRSANMLLLQNPVKNLNVSYITETLSTLAV
jgi:hypothetical protein